MKRFFFIIVFSLSFVVFSQQLLKPNVAGKKLKQMYLNMQVEKFWLNGTHVDWVTGKPDMPEATTENTTHCSAFVAAACHRVGIYILRPPEHIQELLANAQYDWLISDLAYAEGWRQIKGKKYQKAQNAANKGYMVVAAYQNPNPNKAGHIVCVMPATIHTDSIAAKGPVVIQASQVNSSNISFYKAFKKVIKKWPDTNIQFFYNMRKIE